MKGRKHTLPFRGPVLRFLNQAMCAKPFPVCLPDGSAGCALTAVACIVCRLGLVAADLAAARALVLTPPGGQKPWSGSLNLARKPQALSLARMWLLGVTCGVAGLYAIMKIQARNSIFK